MTNDLFSSAYNEFRPHIREIIDFALETQRGTVKPTPSQSRANLALLTMVSKLLPKEPDLIADYEKLQEEVRFTLGTEIENERRLEVGK